jgi:hypothetical protein
MGTDRVVFVVTDENAGGVLTSRKQTQMAFFLDAKCGLNVFTFRITRFGWDAVFALCLAQEAMEDHLN